MQTVVYIDVKLTHEQIYERRLLLEQELDEQDKLTGDVAEKLRAIKTTKVKIDSVTDRVRQLRREIKLGYVTEAREVQLKLPKTETEEVADTLLERPEDPEAERDTKPPPPPPPPERIPDAFEELYPMARTHSALRDYLHDVLTDEQYVKLTDGTIEAWHERDGRFDGVAHWARVEKCSNDASERAKAGEPTIKGLYVPQRMPMPEPLALLLGEKPGKKKRGARPLTSPAKKRRSGERAAQ